MNSPVHDATTCGQCGEKHWAFRRHKYSTLWLCDDCWIKAYGDPDAEKDPEYCCDECSYYDTHD